MSQALKVRKRSQNVTVARKRQPLASLREHRLERESRLRREEADARWKRIKEMIVIGSVAYISLCAFSILAIVLLSGSYPSTDKLILIGFITQLLTNLFLHMAGKMPDFKK